MGHIYGDGFQLSRPELVRCYWCAWVMNRLSGLESAEKTNWWSSQPCLGSAQRLGTCRNIPCICSVPRKLPQVPRDLCWVMALSCSCLQLCAVPVGRFCALGGEVLCWCSLCCLPAGFVTCCALCWNWEREGVVLFIIHWHNSFPGQGLDSFVLLEILSAWFRQQQGGVLTFYSEIREKNSVVLVG